MSTYEFELYLLWFRILRNLRMGRRSVLLHIRRLVHRLPHVLEGCQRVCVSPLWFTFETCVLAWAGLARWVQARYGYQLREWHRLSFCLALSLSLGHVLLRYTVGWVVSGGSLVLLGGYGLAVFYFWKRGARWGRQILEIRPMPGDALDL